MREPSQIAITGVGIVSPIGIGSGPFWESMRAARSGVRPVSFLAGTPMPVRFGGEIVDFEPKEYVTPRKSLKVMCREIQTGFAAAALAMKEAGLAAGAVDPERFGVTFGSDMLYGPVDELRDPYTHSFVNEEFVYDEWNKRAMGDIFPLWMLKYLPNMISCHVGIAYDARGPSNSITIGDVSSLAAVLEAKRIMDRGLADVMVVGGTGSRLSLTPLIHRTDATMSHREGDPAAACRPFDLAHDGEVNGEGAAAFVLERRELAERRGAKILAVLRGGAEGCEPRLNGQEFTGSAIERTIRLALAQAQLAPADVGHVNAHGLSLPIEDRCEAQAIRRVLGDVPVTAPKSFFGNLGAGSGAVEMAASVLSFQHGEVPITLNYETPDPECPVRVVHGQPLSHTARTAVVLNHTLFGQSAAVVLTAD